MLKNNYEDLMKIVFSSWVTGNTLPSLSLQNSSIAVAQGSDKNSIATLGAGNTAFNESELSSQLRTMTSEVQRLRYTTEQGPLSATATPIATYGDGLSEIVREQVAAAMKTVVGEPPSKPVTGSKSNDGGIGSTLVSAVGMATGLGPLISGIAGLFGSGGSGPVIEPEQFIAPSSVHVQAGLNSQGLISPISYGQDGLARDSQSRSTPPRVEIHINAMDSRSILDRSDEIARAVQSAMLRSHSLNDVVSEL